MAKQKRKNQPGFVVRMDDEMYEAISIRAGQQGWKVARVVRAFLKRILAHEEMAETILKETMDDDERSADYQ